MFTEGDRSIRKIPAVASHRAPQGGSGHGAPTERTIKSKTSLFFWGLLAVFACAVSGLLLSTFFERADVQVSAKSQTVILPSHMAVSEGRPGGAGLSYTRVLVKSIPKDFIPIQGSLSGGQIAVIDPKELAQAVARQTVAGYTDERVVFADSSGISASVQVNTPTFGHMLITLGTASSSVVLLWQVDAEALQKALLGANRSDFQSIVKTFGESITEAHLRMRPFWKVTLPKDESKLLVNVVEHSQNN